MLLGWTGRKNWCQGERAETVTEAVLPTMTGVCGTIDQEADGPRVVVDWSWALVAAAGQEMKTLSS